MDYRLQNRQGTVAPILLELYNSHRLYSLARDGKPLARAELTSAIAQLFENKLSLIEKEMIADVLTDILRQAERELRQALSERLSVMDNIPLRLVLQLANDEIDIAAPVLMSSPVLTDLDLIYVIKSKSADYWRTIAMRPSMSDQLVKVLAETRDVLTAVNLAENQNIHFTSDVLNILSDMAHNNDNLALPLVQREDIPAVVIESLYKSVGDAVQEYIQRNYPEVAAEASSAIHDVKREFSQALNRKDYTPTDSILVLARKLHKRGHLDAQAMISSLQRGQMAHFIAGLSVYSGLCVKLVQAIIEQPTGKSFAAICKALGFEKADFISMYLLTNRIRSPEKIVNPSVLSKAISFYTGICPDRAKALLEKSRNA